MRNVWYEIMKNILIIGEHSYIGNSFELYCLKQEKCQFKINKVGAANGAWRECNFKKYDVVLLVAAIVHKKETDRIKFLYEKVNKDMAIEIAQKAKEAGVKQLFFLSTMAVFNSKLEKIMKNTEPNPTTLYGKSKLEAEKKLIELSNSKFLVTILRPPMVYGLNCPGNFSKLKKIAKYSIIFPKVINQRSMIYIETLCIYMENMIKIPKTGIYHVQNNKYVTTSDMFIRIRKAYGKHTFIIPGFQNIIRFISKRSSFFHKVFGDCYYDLSLLNEIPQQYKIENEISFEKSIEKSIKI